MAAFLICTLGPTCNICSFLRPSISDPINMLTFNAHIKVISGQFIVDFYIVAGWKRIDDATETFAISFVK